MQVVSEVTGVFHERLRSANQWRIMGMNANAGFAPDGTFCAIREVGIEINALRRLTSGPGSNVIDLILCGET